MKFEKIKEIARGMGINPGKMDRTELIRAIQRTEGYRECFATDETDKCGQVKCLWRSDCQYKSRMKWTK